MTAARKACGGFCQIALLALARACRWREELWAENAEYAVDRSALWGQRASKLAAKAEAMAR